MQTNSVTAPNTRRPVRVVLVDDSAIVCERLVEVLSAIDQVEVVGCGENFAVGRQLLLDQDPDVLVLDIDLPDQSGIDLLQIAHLQKPTRMIVMLTNHDHPRLRERCRELGANFYFHKPTEITRIIDVCEEMVRGRDPSTELQRRFARLESLVRDCRADLRALAAGRRPAPGTGD